jgi:predicted dithiol-disulfide oxidoreductase (DUF899 family)
MRPLTLVGGTCKTQNMALPAIVSADEWQKARDELLVAEKQATRVQDQLAARRRRLPMVAFPKRYEFDSPSGVVTLLDLFDGRDELVVYQFMDVGPDGLCPGCTFFTNNVAALDILAGEGVSWATVSNMPLEQIERAKADHNWTLPFVSSHGTSFAADCGADSFMISAFVRDGENIYRTYSTRLRGADRLLFVNNILDLTVYGRQEDWEDSPPGWPQHPTYG